MEYPGNSDKYSRLQQNTRDRDFERAEDVYAVEDVLFCGDDANVLDIGSGIGRASVAIQKMKEDGDVCFWLLDGEGEKQVAGVNQSIGKHFYNNFEAAVEFCTANGIKPENVMVLDAANMNDVSKWLEAGDTKFDLAYSFRALGFHWPISPRLDWLANFMQPHGTLVFESRPMVPESYPEECRFDGARKIVQRDITYLIDSPYWSLIEYRTRIVGQHLRAFIIADRRET